MAYVCKDTLLVISYFACIQLYCCDDKIAVTGVESNASRITVDRQGTFTDGGHDYYSAHANANILSFAIQVDNGAQILYDNVTDVFTTRF